MPLPLDEHTRGTGGPYQPAHVGDRFAGVAGRSLAEGLLRFHDAATAQLYRPLLLDAFPGLRRVKAAPLAFDWNGRQILATRDGLWAPPYLLRADIGRGEVEDVGGLDDFEAGLADGTLAARCDEDRYQEWRRGDAEPLGFDECVEFAVPLFVGGPDALINLARTSMAVSWEVGVQLWTQVRDLPPGTPLILSLDKQYPPA